jgi:hypothetical protein
MRNAIFWVISLRVVVFPCRCFGTTYRSKLHEPHLKMGPIGLPEMSAMIYYNSMRNNPKERISSLLRGGSLISAILTPINHFNS